MRTSKQVIRDEAIYEVREEFEHNTQRMAAAIFDLREGFNTSQAGTEQLANQIRTLQDEVAQRGTILAEQEQEIENHSVSAIQQKELIAELQRKLLAGGDETLKLAEELSASLRHRLAESQKHLSYVERVTWELSQAEENLKRIEAYRRTVDKLSAENVDLHSRLSARIIWRAPISLAKAIHDKLSRRREVLALPQGN